MTDALKPANKGPVRRHDLLTVDPGAWAAILAAAPHLAEVDPLRDWAGRGWPVMVRRRLDGDDPAALPVAVAMPRHHAPNRFAFSLPANAVRARRPPPTLRGLEVPPAWDVAAGALLALASQVGIEPRVFGSLLWQSITGLPYLAASSDIDLIWPVTEPDGLRPLCDGLAAIEAATGRRIDGELIEPGGAAVQWREYASGAADLMVRTMDVVALRARTAFCPPAGALV